MTISNNPVLRFMWAALLVMLCPALVCWATWTAGASLAGPSPDGSHITHWGGWALQIGGIAFALFLLGGLAASALQWEER